MPKTITSRAPRAPRAKDRITVNVPDTEEPGNSVPSHTSNALFETAPIPRAYFTMALPVVLSMVVTLIYNTVDTYVIAHTGDTAMVAGVSLATPVFTAMIAFGDIFGLGGASVISRLLGQGRAADARRISVFCLWGAIATGVAVTTLGLVFQTPILRMLGATAETMPHAAAFYRWIILGAPFIIVSFTPGNLLRTAGLPIPSMLGTVIGTVVNIALNPLFVHVFGWGAAGSAGATFAANVIGDAYFFWVMLRRCDALSMNPRLMFNRVPIDMVDMAAPTDAPSSATRTAHAAIDESCASHAQTAPCESIEPAEPAAHHASIASTTPTAHGASAQPAHTAAAQTGASALSRVHTATAQPAAARTSADGNGRAPRTRLRLAISRRELGGILAIGIPASITNVMQSLGVILVNLYLLRYGTDTVAAMGVALKIVMIAVLVLVGFAFGAQPLIGYNYGRRDFARLRGILRFALGFECVLALTMTVALWAGAHMMMGFFIADPAVVALGAGMLRVQLPSAVCVAVTLVMTATFQSTGKAVGALVLSASRQGVALWLTLAVGSAVAGYWGVVAAQALADLLTALIAVALFFVLLPELRGRGKA